MDNRYIAYLPDTVKELREFRKLGEVEGLLLEEAAEAKAELTDNQWILTAHRSGLMRLAKMMGFLGAEVLETEELREELLSRWSSRSPYTSFHLQEWLDGCLGEGNYSMDLQRERYFLQLVLKLQVKEKMDFLEKHLRKIIPANLVLETKLNANTHRTVGIMTHRKLKELTYGQIPFEDLTIYTE